MERSREETRAYNAAKFRQEWLDDFIVRAGFTGGWENLESWARRMAEQAYEDWLQS